MTMNVEEQRVTREKADVLDEIARRILDPATPPEDLRKLADAAASELQQYAREMRDAAAAVDSAVS